MKFVAHFNTRKIAGEELMAKLKAAHEQLKVARMAVQEALYRSPEGSLINKSGSVEGMDFNGDFSTISVTYSVTQFADVTIMMKEEMSSPLKPYIPETVLNTMLHSKLLSDAEKRAVLVAQGYLTEKKNEQA